MGKYFRGNSVNYLVLILVLVFSRVGINIIVFSCKEVKGRVFSNFLK